MTAGEETRYIGDAVALVAARSRKIAREALALIKVDYEELEPVTTTAFTLSDGAPKIHDKPQAPTIAPSAMTPEYSESSSQNSEYFETIKPFPYSDF